ncbi:substrate binding domain-containing protein [Roseobacter sp. S98]|uniref:substrate binding domain-containing protein n=1 Tax=Roseobacter algicola (ex Choi et al. 2025) (nom. illeg.) TaxID=3092138 RepID=UPI0035C72168
MLHRTPRSVTLTDTGQAYFTRCQPLLDQFDELEGLVRGKQSELSGKLRLAAPTEFGSTCLAGALHSFQIAHPRVRIELSLSDHHVSVVELGFDIAIRLGELRDSNLVARKLMDIRIVCVAAPGYLNEQEWPCEPAALATHNCLLQPTGADSIQWAFHRHGKTETVQFAGGLGIGRIPFYTARPFLEAGALTVLFEEAETDPIGLFAEHPPGRHLTARIRALTNHLRKTLNLQNAGSGRASGADWQ